MKELNRIEILKKDVESCEIAIAKMEEIKKSLQKEIEEIQKKVLTNN